MKRFQLTLNMPSVSNNLVHQVICDYDADSLEDLLDSLHENDFILVEQYYKDRENQNRLVNVGPLIVNTSMIGKAAVYDPDGPLAIKRPF